MAIVEPFPLLVARFEHFLAKTIHHAYYAHMAVVELVVGPTRANNLYGLALLLAMSGIDILGRYHRFLWAHCPHCAAAAYQGGPH